MLGKGRNAPAPSVGLRCSPSIRQTQIVYTDIDYVTISAIIVFSWGSKIAGRTHWGPKTPPSRRADAPAEMAFLHRAEPTSTCMVTRTEQRVMSFII